MYTTPQTLKGIPGPPDPIRSYLVVCDLPKALSVSCAPMDSHFGRMTFCNIAEELCYHILSLLSYIDIIRCALVSYAFTTLTQAH